MILLIFKVLGKGKKLLEVYLIVFLGLVVCFLIVIIFRLLLFVLVKVSLVVFWYVCCNCCLFL